MRVGVVGCGNISDIYIRNARMFADIDVVACADIRPEAAGRIREAHGIPVLAVDDLLTSRDIDIVLNLTIPAVHAQVSRQALAAGKHVYSEKPLATTLEDGLALIEEAERRNLRVGCAPDTILGAGLQTARALIDDGKVGPVITGLAVIMSKGMEHWHPNPSFFYQKGAGPVLDLGPYYIAALTALLGPVAAVRAVGAISPLERRYGAEGPNKGKMFPVDTFTTLNAILTFAGGSHVSFMASWDVWKHGARPIELHGTLASIRVPDPDTFGGQVEISANHPPLNMHDPKDAALVGTREDWLVTDTADKAFGGINYPFGHPRIANYRSLGLADMANAIKQGRPHRCSGRFALHALAVMCGVLDSATTGLPVAITVPGDTPAAISQDQANVLLRM